MVANSTGSFNRKWLGKKSMEHRAPRLPESIFENDIFNAWPFHKFDFIRLTLHMEKLIEKETEEEFECRLEMVVSVIRELAAVINAIVGRHRELVKLIRRCKKKGTPEGDALAQDYERQRQVVLCDAASLSEGISRNRFGSLFPKTRRRLARRIKWLVTSNKRSDETLNATDPETLSRPPAVDGNFVSKNECFASRGNDYTFCISRRSGIIDFSGGVLKTLSDKYLRNYNPS